MPEDLSTTSFDKSIFKIELSFNLGVLSEKFDDSKPTATKNKAIIIPNPNIKPKIVDKIFLKKF